ncbi:uncharacterized protein LOC107036423 [Diachasma alloeum]|uniref:uncharacterized protein LOC107036423 n=1 Tax=Diachasma alloeum TaxID=454923 RepID=UPI0007382841|nr:uncharacterized protein LOC107036423 [Diachasma alloeum]
MDKELTSKRTPLRNSSLANRPFRSPFASLTPKSDIKKSSPLITSTSTPTTTLQNSTPKRASVFPDKSQIKKRRIEIEVCEDNRENKPVPFPSKPQLLALKKTIRDKRQQVDSLKAQLACRKKHNREDLHKEIDRWRTACQSALVQFQKDWNDTNAEGVYYDMRRILAMLNIPEEVVKFPDEADLT